MTFTNELPTSAGNFLWRSGQDSEPELVKVTCDGETWFAGLEIKILVKHMGGQWCRLVPAEEMEKAWFEARSYGPTGRSCGMIFWHESRAKRVMEGKE